MKRKIQLLCSLLVCSLLPAGAQSLFEKHARMLTLPEGYVMLSYGRENTDRRPAG